MHAAVVGVRFVDPVSVQRAFDDSPLEVILVNSRSALPPTVAQAIAQANLDGGGNAASGRSSSPLPASTLVEFGDSDEDTQRRIEQLQQAQEQLLAVVKRELAQMPLPDPQRDQGKPQDAAEQERRRQLLELLAEIERRIQEDNASPRRRYVSPATREAVYAQYYDHLRRKIEDRGTRNFPVHDGKKLYGDLTMNVTVNARGQVVDTAVVRSSGSPILDRYAVAIVNAAAPLGEFTAEMRRKADELVITSRFRFTRDESLQTTLSAKP
ncbi:energy transducer TonB [Piscinibacter sakaiensis]|uniref:energy transducer TonB n=1 Tax=Piscinibacter sakaiensis TaxID=1547922 RepID=UPI003AADF2D8